MHIEELLNIRQSRFVTVGHLDTHMKFFTTGVSSAHSAYTKVNFVYELMFHYSYSPRWMLCRQVVGKVPLTVM